MPIPDHVTPLDGTRYDWFVWGPVDRIHRVGPYAVVEYRCDLSSTISSDYSRHGRTYFHPYFHPTDDEPTIPVNELSDSCAGTSSLDEALLVAMDQRRNGFGSHASVYAARVLDIPPG